MILMLFSWVIMLKHFASVNMSRKKPDCSNNLASISFVIFPWSIVQSADLGVSTSTYSNYEHKPRFSTKQPIAGTHRRSFSRTTSNDGWSPKWTKPIGYLLPETVWSFSNLHLCLQMDHLTTKKTTSQEQIPIHAVWKQWHGLPRDLVHLNWPAGQ